MSDRKAELERKKAKLQAMRDEKKRREEEKRRKELEDAAAKQASVTSTGDLRRQTEQMLDELIGPGTGNSPNVSTSPIKKLDSPIPPGESQGDQPSVVHMQHSSQSHQRALSMSKPTQTSIPPKEVVTYNKEVQTTIIAEHGDKEVLTFDTTAADDDADSLEVGGLTPPVGKMPHVESIKPLAEADEDKKAPKEEKPEPVRELSEEEKKQILGSEEFFKFFDRASRIMERALCEDETNILVDYTGGDKSELEGELQAGERLKLSRNFFDERWSKHRTVTCIDWSTQFPELLAASYNNNEESPHDPDGVVLVWNLKFKKNSPEYIFHCQSAVMSTCFAKFHPNLVVGGTYSGQIVLWDNRSSKRTPVQRTPLSAAAHTHPVYCVNVVGTQNAHNLISVSTDGKMCSWSLDMLSQPQDSIELQHRQSKAVAVTSFSFLAGDVNNFVVGSEEGAVYTACRHGSKAGIGEMFEGHQGPVTGVDCHNVQGQIDFSQLFLTSSFDWTIKLWSIKEQKPLYSFEDNGDYVYDVSWSPIHPALFASVDGQGRLDLWNLNHDTEVPYASTYVAGSAALNRCRWHQSGHQIAAGDDMGRIHIYDIAEHLAHPKNDDWTKFVHTMQEIRNNASDREDEISMMTSPIR